PSAMLMGLRGRSTESGTLRWFRGFGPGSYDQKDVRFEAGAFEAFIGEIEGAYGLTRQKSVGLGYSNGANFLAAAMLLHPGLVKRAVLLRPAMVLDEVPEGDLTGTQVLIVAGEKDAFRGEGEKLAQVMMAAGAEVTTASIADGHALTDADADIV